MHSRKLNNHRSGTKYLHRDKISSPHLLKPSKTDKVKHSSKQQIKPQKKAHFKKQNNLQQSSAKNSLFISLQELPQIKVSKPHNRKQKKKPAKKTLSNYNNEDSTASRQFKHYLKHYDSPNGEYFGSKISCLDPKQTQRTCSQEKNKSIQQRKTRSLQRKIREYRRLSSQHRSQSESLKSEISDKEMHRLKKIHSIQKMILMQEIMTLEEKRLHLKTKK